MPMLLLILLGYVLVVPGAGLAVEGYSCTDSDGVRHFSDTQAGLPEECLGQEQKLKNDESGTLNFVPPTPEPPESSSRFEESVRAEERSLQQKRQLAEQLLTRAEGLANQYREAVLKKYDARKSWTYSSRQVLVAAEQEMAAARKGKQQLLDELAEQRLRRDDEEKIRRKLAEIPDQD